MSFAPSVSIIVPNWDRIDLLRRVLRSFEYLEYPKFEVIIVSNLKDPHILHDLKFGRESQFIFFEGKNISRARNLGIAKASGEIVAFIDDDAVPESYWLKELIKPFENKNVMSAGGFVLGRNGISYQWKAHLSDHYGNDVPLNIPEFSEYKIIEPQPECCLKTVGTNSAFRKENIIELGGFDEAIHFYLDETDLNFRLAREGWLSASAPRAIVHHGYAASAYRTANRVPSSLFEIGASKILFCKKYAPQNSLEHVKENFYNHQKHRLLTLMHWGQLEPIKVNQLLDTLLKGYSEGARRSPCLAPIQNDQKANKPIWHNQGKPESIILQTSVRHIFSTLEEAELLASKGKLVTIIAMEHSVRYLQVLYHKGGFWLHKGGFYGKGNRSDLLFRYFTKEDRFKLEDERARLMRQASNID